jgi:hypothetical protein
MGVNVPNGGSGRRRLARWAVALAAAVLMVAAAPVAAGASLAVHPNRVGMLDCNGRSPVQRQTLRQAAVCSDPRSLYDGKPTRFTDNGEYIGHDEPIIRFLSRRPGSGNNITWRERLPFDPKALPTVAHPGKDTTHWFELSIAPWFSMALCNAKSYPLNPCKPRSDSNAPHHPPTFDQGGGGSSFLEMQFYPPGFAPFADAESCDNTHWCASLHINDLECQLGFVNCNPNCEEPTNFAFIQRDGVPTGPPSPQRSNAATATPNGQTLLMNPGDRLVIHIWDARLRGGGHALETSIRDLTTGQSGFMIASARNGFMATSIADCSGTPFNYQPEYSTAKPQNIIPWAALETNISTQFEIGHFEPCRRVTDPMPFSLGTFSDTVWQNCVGPYENPAFPDGLPGNAEISDSPCWPDGFTHGGVAAPNEVAGCLEEFAQNGDLDYDGTSYRADWPNSLRPGPFPSPFLQKEPMTRGHSFPTIQFQTDAAASESTCSPTTLSGCAVPPPIGPGHFYPYWTQAKVHGRCVWEFGQMQNGDAFGGTAQYGSPSAYFFGNLEGPMRPNPHCST